MSPSTIQRAVQRGDVDELQRLLESGADPNEPGVTGITALFRAVLKGDEASVRLLLEHGADSNRAGNGISRLLPDDADYPPMAPLLTAITRRHASIARLLLQAGADPNVSAGEFSALSVAATIGGPELLTLLLEFGACPPPGHGRKVALLLRNQPEIAARILALDEADLCSPAEAGNLDRLRSRLAQGADPNQPDAYGMRPLIAAARMGQADAVKLLLDGGAEIDTGTTASDNPLVMAIGARSAETVRLLLERGADPNFPGPPQTSALTQAILAGSGMATLFTERGIVLNTHQRAMLGNREAILQAMDAGLSPDARDESGLPLLHAVARSGCVRLVQQMLDRGADPTACDSHGNSVLSAAAVSGNLELVELLLAVDLLAGQQALDRAFGVAALRGLRPIATLLRSRGANPNGGAPLRPLTSAVMVGDTERLRWLLELSSSPDACEGDTNPPVHWAIINGQTECLRILIEAGADLNACSASGKLGAIELVRNHRHPEMEAMLLSAGAVEGPPSPHPGREKAMAAVREWFESQRRSPPGD